jgi:hypothetical protein
LESKYKKCGTIGPSAMFQSPYFAPSYEDWG